MPTLHIADATALMKINECVYAEMLADLFEDLTGKIEKNALGFPRAVINDLKVRARDERITSWALGLSPTLKKFVPQLPHRVWISRQFQLTLGFDEGVEDIDGTEPSIVEIAALARQCQSTQVDFIVISEDCTPSPLRPTMLQLCTTFEWEVIGTIDYIKSIGHDDCLRPN